MCSRPQFTVLTYMEGTRPCRAMTIIFGCVIQSQYTSVNIKFGVNRTFHVLNSITIIFCSVIKSQYTSLNIKFGVNRTFQVLKTPVYRFGLYGRYQTLWTDDDNFWQCYLELVYKPKYEIWCESEVPCAQDHSYRFDLYRRYQVLCTDDDYFWQCYLELAYKSKYQIWCESNVPCAQDPSLPM